MQRRELLKATGVAGTAGILGLGVYATTGDSDDGPAEQPASETGEVSPEPESTETENGDSGPEMPYEEEYDTVVDAVEEGADPDGDEPVNFLFEEYGDDTLLCFEDGTFQIEQFSITDQQQLGIVGVGDEPATFVPSDGQCRGGHPWIFFDSVSDLQLEHLTFDFRDTDAGGPLHLFLRGESTIRDVSYLGTCSNQLGVSRAEVRDPDGEAHFERFEARNTNDNETLTGLYVGSNHAGSLTFEDCTFSGFSDNGLYASAPGGQNGRDGDVAVIGGHYENNNIANVRLGSTGATARDVTVVVDSNVPGWGQRNARGIRLRNNDEQLIENCEIRFGEEAADSFGAVVFHGNNGGATVRDTAIELDSDSTPAIRAFSPETSAESPPVFQNITVTGTAAGGVTADIEGRDGTVFENCTIEQTGDSRGGIEFVGSENCRIVDSEIDVTEEPVTVRNGTVEIEDSTIHTASGEEEIDQLALENESLSV